MRNTTPESYSSYCYLLYGFRCEDVFTMNNDRMCSELWRIVLIEPVVVFGKVTLLRNPEFDSIVFYLDETKTNAAQRGDEE